MPAFIYEEFNILIHESLTRATVMELLFTRDSCATVMALLFAGESCAGDESPPLAHYLATNRYWFLFATREKKPRFQSNPRRTILRRTPCTPGNRTGRNGPICCTVGRGPRSAVGVVWGGACLKVGFDIADVGRAVGCG